MELSRHAEARTQQRGFQNGDVALIITFGTPIQKPGNVIEYRMRQKDGKRLVQAVDRIKDKAVLVNHDEGIVVTVYNLDKKR
jgi:hypothetical protein